MNALNCSNINYKSYFAEEKFLSSLNSHQKKISAIALIIISGLALCFLLIRYALKKQQQKLSAQSNKLPVQITQQLNPAQEESPKGTPKPAEEAKPFTQQPNPAQEETPKGTPKPAEEAKPFTQQPNPAQEETPKGTPKPAEEAKPFIQQPDSIQKEIPKDTPKPIEKKAKPFVQQPDTTQKDTLKPILEAKPFTQQPDPTQQETPKDSPKPIEEAKAFTQQAELVPQEAIPNSIKETSTPIIMRMIKYGMEGEELNENILKEFDEIVKAFRDHKSKAYVNNDPRLNLVLIKIDDFGKNNNLLYPKFELFLRYLIVKGEIFAYVSVRAGYYLYLNEKATQHESYNPSKVGNPPDSYFDFEKLKSMDDQFCQIPEPILTNFSNSEKDLAKEIIKTIKEKYYMYFNCPDYQGVRAFALSQLIYNAGVPTIMDQLVKNGFIHSWNVNVRGDKVVVKLRQTDSCETPPDLLLWSDWRDPKSIEDKGPLPI